MAADGPRRGSRRALVWWWVALAAVVTVTVLVVRAQTSTGTPAALESAGAHVTHPVTYEVVPPTSGKHHPVWWDCGAYEQPVPAEHAVHSLEHGAVWITYRPDVPAPVVTELRRLTARGHVLLSPLPHQDSPVVVSAWSVQLRLDVADVERVQGFVATHRLGAGAPESGGLCTNGTTRDLVDRTPPSS